MVCIQKLMKVFCVNDCLDFEAFKASQNLKELCDLVAANKLEVSQAESSEEEGEASGMEIDCLF